MESANPYAAPAAEVRDILPTEDATIPADRLRRLGAVILDGVIAALLIVLPAGLFAGFEAVFSGQLFEIQDMPASAALGSLVGATFLIAVTWYLVHRNGQTIGKKMLGIKVVRTDGSRATVARIFWVRNVPVLLLGAIPLYIGDLFSLVDALLIFRASNQCLHDQFADTIVINA